MIIICHNCDSRYKVRDDTVAQGPKKARCKNCGAEMLIIQPAIDKPVTDGLLTFPVNPETANKVTPASREGAVPEKSGMPSRPAADGDGISEGRPVNEDDAKKEDDAESDNQETNAENAMSKLEKRRREMEDEIAGRLHKAALETLEFHDLDFLGKKLKNIEANPDNRFEEGVQLFVCIKCKEVFALYPEDARQCPNCTGDTPLIRGQELLRQFGMFNR